MKAPAECSSCGHLIQGTTCGEPRDACRRGLPFSNAEICQRMGWHETPEQIRVRSVLTSIANRDALLQQIGFESPRRREKRALGVGK